MKTFINKYPLIKSFLIFAFLTPTIFFLLCCIADTYSLRTDIILDAIYTTLSITIALLYCISFILQYYLFLLYLAITTYICLLGIQCSNIIYKDKQDYPWINYTKYYYSIYFIVSIGNILRYISI